MVGLIAVTAAFPIMNASRAAEPHPRYVLLTGRMDPKECTIVLPFNDVEVFPREKTIRLELIEFELCTRPDHPHFGDPDAVAFPPTDQPYQPYVQVRRPAPLPATRRRRTDYYVPVFGASLLPPRTSDQYLPAADDDGDNDDNEEEEEDDDDDDDPDTHEPLPKKRKQGDRNKAEAEAEEDWRAPGPSLMQRLLSKHQKRTE